MVKDIEINTSKTFYFDKYDYKNVFGLGNLKDETVFVYRWYSCRDEFIRNLSEYKCWVYILRNRDKLDNIMEFLLECQKSMKISKDKQFTLLKNENYKCIIALPSAFWMVPIRASFYSLLCRIGKYYDPTTKNVIEPLNHSQYLRSKGALFAAQKFLEGHVNIKTKQICGWRDYFSGRKVETIKQLLGVS